MLTGGYVVSIDPRCHGTVGPVVPRVAKFPIDVSGDQIDWISWLPWFRYNKGGLRDSD